MSDLVACSPSMIWIGLPGIKCKKRNERTVIVKSTAAKRSTRCAMKLATVEGLSVRAEEALHMRSKPAQEARGGPQTPFS